MKLFTTIMISFVLGAGLSCTDGSVDNVEETTCLRAKFIANYCPSGKALHLIQFLEPTELATAIKSQTSDTIRYYAAVLDLPESVRKPDTEFYLRFHYDQAEESKYRPKVCQQVFTDVKLIVCDGASKDSCQSITDAR